MSINRDDVKKLARLTRLSLTESEEAEATKTLNAVLALIDELQRADVEGIGEMSYVQVRGRTLRCRDAQPKPALPREKLLENAPREGGGEYFLVPKVVE